MKILHLINSLDIGGAEKNLYKICISDKKNDHIVVSLSDKGFYGNLLSNKGFLVFEIDLKKNWFFFFKIIKIIYLYKPNIIQSWMYISDFIASLTIFFTFKKNIIWNVRHSFLNPLVEKKQTIIIVKLLSFFSYLIPKKIIFCSKKSKKIHLMLGYNPKILLYIPNGYSINNENKSKKKILKYLRFGKNIFLIGSSGRYHPYKDFNNLFAALKIVKKNLNFKFILMGKNNTYKNSNLVELIKKNHLMNQIYLLGLRKNTKSVFNSLDLFVLSSNNEAFPNVVAEAMACGVPCVVTNVGDAADIVGNTGWVVPSRNSRALANSIKKAFKESRHHRWNERRQLAKKRIKNHFSLKKMIFLYNQAWNNLK